MTLLVINLSNTAQQAKLGFYFLVKKINHCSCFKLKKISCHGKIHAMAMIVETLPDDPKALKEIILELQNKNNFLMEQFRLSRQKQFGASSESAPGQGHLFNEAEQEACSDQEITETKDIPAHTRKKPVRTPLPKDLPRETRVIDLADEDKVCACCNGALHKMGEETREQLEFIPAQIKVIETVRLKYSCRACEKNNIKTPVKTAPLPASPIPKSIATASLLAQIITNKYQYALPLYRQEAMFKQHGIELSRKTMSDWVIKCAALVQPTINRLKNHQLQQGIIHADETPLKVIESDKQKCYMWVYCTGTDSPKTNQQHKNIILYDYQPSRAATCPQHYLGNYAGYLQVDGYSAYESTQAQLVGCMAHARRKFIEAQKAQPKGKTGKADWAINLIQKLYALEAKIKTFSETDKHQSRQQKALPLLQEFKNWLDKSSLTIAPKTALGSAIGYTLNQWHKLIRYTENGGLSIDNNRAERANKPFVIGRKNWLFSNTSRGANASAVLYSLIETAKANGIEPLNYLQKLFDEIPRRDKGDLLEDLMPWALKV